MSIKMSEWYDTTVFIDQDVVPIEPFPEYVQDFFKAYAKSLKEVYKPEKDNKMTLEWKKVSYENPPVGIEILYAIPASGRESCNFKIYIAKIERPFEKDNMYHPDYYVCSSLKNYEGEYHSIRVSTNHYWANIEVPKAKEHINDQKDL